MFVIRKLSFPYVLYWLEHILLHHVRTIFLLLFNARGGKMNAETFRRLIKYACHACAYWALTDTTPFPTMENGCFTLAFVIIVR